MAKASTPVDPVLAMGARGLTFAKVLRLLSADGDIPAACVLSTVALGRHPVAKGYLDLRDAPAQLWIARVAGVRRQSVLEALLAGLRAGVVRETGTREAQLYLGALDVIGMHVQGHPGVAAGDLRSLDLDPPLPAASKLSRVWAQSITSLVTLLQHDRWCLTLDGIEDLLSHVGVGTTRGAASDGHGYTMGRRISEAVAVHLPWEKVVAPAVWATIAPKVGR